MSAAIRMSARHGGSPARQVSVRAWLLLAVVAATGVAAPAGCSSSKPAYCSDRASLQDSVKGLTSLNAGSGVSGLESQVSMIESNANAVISSAKGDFPGETSAISSSVTALKNSVTNLPSSPSAADIATVTKNAASVVSSVKSFMDASNSKCG